MEKHQRILWFVVYLFAYYIKISIIWKQVRFLNILIIILNSYIYIYYYYDITHSLLPATLCLYQGYTIISYMVYMIFNWKMDSKNNKFTIFKK